MPRQKVLVVPPTRSRATGRMMGWTCSHALDCWFANRHNVIYPYVTMDASDVPAHVGRCGHCGGGR